MPDEGRNSTIWPIWSLPKIGRFYNGRHHTTVLHAIAKIEGLRKDEAFDVRFDLLTATLISENYETGQGRFIGAF